MCLCVFLLGFILPGTLCFLDFADYFLSHVREVFSYYLFRYFFRSFLSLFSFWDPYNVDVDAFNVVPGVSGCLHFFSFFFQYCFVAVIFTILFSSSLEFVCLSHPAIDSFQCIVHLCSLVLLSLWLHFLHLFFSEILDDFHYIILNSLSGRLPISTSFSCFTGDLSCPFI